MGGVNGSATTAYSMYSSYITRVTTNRLLAQVRPSEKRSASAFALHGTQDSFDNCRVTIRYPHAASNHFCGW